MNDQQHNHPRDCTRVIEKFLYVPTVLNRAGDKRRPVSSKSSLQAISITPKISPPCLFFLLYTNNQKNLRCGDVCGKKSMNVPAASKAFFSGRYLSSSESTIPPGICIWTTHTYMQENMGSVQEESFFNGI